MVDHNTCICFYGEIWLIIPKLSLLPLLIWSTVCDMINVLSMASKKLNMESGDKCGLTHIGIASGIFLAFLGRGPRTLWVGNFISV